MIYNTQGIPSVEDDDVFTMVSLATTCGDDVIITMPTVSEEGVMEPQFTEEIVSNEDDDVFVDFVSPTNVVCDVVSVTSEEEVVGSESTCSSSLVDPSLAASIPSTSTEVWSETGSSTSTSISQEDLLSQSGYIDEHLAKAAIDAVQTGKLTPIIKEELRLAIQTKRLQSGQDELESEVPQKKQKVTTSPLTDEEKERAKRRRERNKLAAQRCRSKKRERADELEEETKQLESRNESLKSQISFLEDERSKLMLMLRRHDKSTQCQEKMCSNHHP